MARPVHVSSRFTVRLQAAFFLAAVIPMLIFFGYGLGRVRADGVFGTEIPCHLTNSTAPGSDVSDGGRGGTALPGALPGARLHWVPVPDLETSQSQHDHSTVTAQSPHSDQHSDQVAPVRRAELASGAGTLGLAFPANTDVELGGRCNPAPVDLVRPLSLGLVQGCGAPCVHHG